MAQEVRGWITKLGKHWYARLDYHDHTGRRLQMKRKAANQEDAKRILKECTERITWSGSTETAKLKFDDLAAFYRQHYLVPAEYHNGKKVGGLKSLKPTESFLSNLEAHFNGMRLSDITYTVIASYRLHRLQEKVKFKHKPSRTRSASSVNRELEVLRKMLNVAVSQRWIQRNPFRDGEPLISRALENVRERILSVQEEARLLEHCVDDRAHLYPYVVCAVDTGMRPGEMAQVVKRDLDFDKRVIHVWETHTKTEQYRMVPMSERLAEVLKRYTHGINAGDKVFPHKCLKRSFKTACKLAGIQGLTIYCLRHTFGTRLAQAGLDLATLGRAMGHTKVETTYRYVNQDYASIQLTTNLINSLQSNKRE